MKTKRDFGKNTVSVGYRIHDGSGFVPMFAATGTFEERCEARTAAIKEYPHLRYEALIQQHIPVLCVTGAFFLRPDAEMWIVAENIKLLRDLPNNEGDDFHIDDKPALSLAIEHFLSLHLGEDYAETENLRY